MKIKKLSKYSEKFNLYLEKVSASENPEQKISLYNKILKIIKRLQFIETKGKVRVKPSLISWRSFSLKGKNILLKNLNRIKLILQLRGIEKEDFFSEFLI